MSITAVQSKLNQFINDPVKSDRLGYLWSRWQDEKEYEDFGEYEKVLRTLVPEGFTFVKSSKRPFGMRVSYSGIHAVVTVTGRSIGWKIVQVTPSGGGQ